MALLAGISVYPPANDGVRGREAAQVIWHHAHENPTIADPFTEAFADAALDELEHLQDTTPGIFQKLKEGATHSAEQLNVEPFHGVVEAIQNADDVGAPWVRLAIHRGDDLYHLLFVHNGARVNLLHAVAMAFPYFSTKGGEVLSKGRFGIGLKTLGQIATGLSVHSAPYHFNIEDGRLRRCGRQGTIHGFFEDGHTLLDIRLRPGTGEPEFRAWFDSWDASALLFLDSIRRVTLVDLDSGAVLAERCLVESDRQRVVLTLHEGTIEGERLVLEERGAQRAWTRYSIEYPVPKSIGRAHKETGPRTPLGIAVPHISEPCQVFAGLPTAVPSDFPFSVNAQFDPATSRSQLQHTKWNDWLLSCLADLAGAVALHRFAEDPRSGWAAVPLRRESAGGPDAWLRDRADALVHAVQNRVRSDLRLPTSAEGRSLCEIVYEDAGLEGILSPEDQELLHPGLLALPASVRDLDGRWRAVLADLGEAKRITIDHALKMLDWPDEQLGQRPVSWFISLAAVAIAAALGGRLRVLRSVLLADGQRLSPQPPSGSRPHLVSLDIQNPLASLLGLVHQIHPAYLSSAEEARQVKEWLQGQRLLVESLTIKQVLETIIERGREKPIPLSDDERLRLLRSALSSMDADDQRRLGQGIGSAVLVDGFRWVEKKRHEILVRPAGAYQPSAIEGGPDSWGKAAGQTPGLRWIGSRHADVLRSGAGGNELGARAFFSLLGAEVAPRLQPPPDQESRYSDFAAPISYQTAPASQRDALRAFHRHPSHLKGDRFSPDLDAVLADIITAPVPQRRDRAKALMATLTRAYRRLYSDHEMATAVFSEYTWRSLGEVPATWLANAMSQPWLSNLEGMPKAPRELAVRTPKMLAVFGEQDRWFAAELDADDVRSLALTALGVETYPRASRIVEELVSLRDASAAGEQVDPPEPARLYGALAELCPQAGAGFAPETKIDDLSVRALRGKFGIARNQAGLIFVDNGWLPPTALFRGRPIFGHYERFVPERAHAARLWDVLGVREPTADDCIKILRRMAREPITDIDLSVLIETYRHLASQLEGMSRRVRRAIRSLPLWCGNRWVATRPIYAVRNSSLALALSEQIPIWDPQASLATIGSLVGPLGITLLDEETFMATGITAEARSKGLGLADRFQSAVQHLRDYLAKNDPSLYRACSVRWEELETAQVIVAPQLGIEVPFRDQSLIHIRTRAHVAQDPLLVCFQDDTATGDYEAGGRAIASLFTHGKQEDLDQDKVALAWSVAWQRAESDQTPLGLRLAEDQAVGHGDPLEPLATKIRQGPRTRRVIDRSIPRPRSEGDAQSVPLPPPLIRRLKGLDTLDIGSVEVINEQADQGTVRRAVRRGLKANIPDPFRNDPTRRVPVHSQVAYSDRDLEEAAFKVLAAVLESAGEETIVDFRHLRGIGADALDDLKRFFELKASARDMPDSITLSANEAARAARAGDDFFLVIVAGLEEGYETTVRIFAQPLKTLDWKPETSVTLSGIRQKKALIITVE